LEHTEAHCQLLGFVNNNTSMNFVVQAEGGPSGSQGSRHSPGPVSQSPAKKQKTAPLVPPAATHIGDLHLSVCVTIHTFILKYIYTSKNYVIIYIYTHQIYTSVQIYVYVFVFVFYVWKEASAYAGQLA